MKSATDIPSFSAAILAGGQSSRMGRNKALLQLEGKSLISRTVEMVASVVESIRIITNTPGEYAFLNIPMVSDEIRGLGPIGGIYTALRHCDSRQCLIVACDLPFLTVELIRFLLAEAGDHDIFAIDAGRGVEPLCTVYARHCLPAIEAQIALKDYKVAHMFDAVDAQIARLTPEDGLFSEHALFNVNTPEDFAKAGELVRIKSSQD